MAGPGTPFTLYDASGSVLGSSANPLVVNPQALDSSKDSVSQESTRATYIYQVSAPALDLTTTATAPVLIVQGQAGIVTRILQLIVWCHATAAADVDVTLRRYSNVSGGTPAPFNTGRSSVNDGLAASTLQYYTAKPPTFAVVEQLIRYCGSVPAANTSPKVPIDLSPQQAGVKPWQAQGIADFLGVCFKTFPAGFVCDGISIVFTEATT